MARSAEANGRESTTKIGFPIPA